ncbi:MAG TPA: hypothetical protein ENN80_14525, partial [Candidatus Hydrogenedentes bacterium]|nr:hypothetical protein [Candidatus Hydrogenedentota bacterium]
YGVVNLRNISGPVRVRQRGAFAFDARTLRQGGTFELNGAHATFRDIAGTVKVNNFGGALEFQELAPDTDLDVTNESGAIVLHLPRDAAPDLVATSLFGEIKSDIELGRSSQGDFTIVRSPNVEAKQRVSLRTSFGDIYIACEGEPEMAPAPALVAGTLPFNDVARHVEPVPEGMPCVVEAIAGDVRVEGVDEDRITVTATKLVRVHDKAHTEAALDSLVFEVERETDCFVIRTRQVGDMLALGCPSYRIDLAVRCPRTSPLTIRAESGRTEVSGTGVAITIEQQAGIVSVEHAKGAQTLVNHKGGVSVNQCTGPVDVSARYGDVRLANIYGPVSVECEQGKTILEALHADVKATNHGGDVRIIALGGIKGAYDVEAEDGSLSIVVPGDANAGFEVLAENGTVFSGIPLSGAIKRDRQEFSRQTPKDAHLVRLRTKDGDIRIN